MVPFTNYEGLKGSLDIPLSFEDSKRVIGWDHWTPVSPQRNRLGRLKRHRHEQHTENVVCRRLRLSSADEKQNIPKWDRQLKRGPRIPQNQKPSRLSFSQLKSRTRSNEQQHFSLGESSGSSKFYDTFPSYESDTSVPLESATHSSNATDIKLLAKAEKDALLPSPALGNANQPTPISVPDILIHEEEHHHQTKDLETSIHTGDYPYTTPFSPPAIQYEQDEPLTSRVLSWLETSETSGTFYEVF